MPNDVIWVAQMDTESYTWIALGRTAEEAGKALADRWNRYAKNNSLPSWAKGWEGSSVGDFYGMWLRPLKIGSGYMEDESEA
jgi:hypothetical protein